MDLGCLKIIGFVKCIMSSRLDIWWASSYSLMESQLYMAQAIVNRVKELRVARGWTQEQLAEAARVSRQSINSIERNRYVPSLELALTFARIFSCRTDEIFHLEKES
jgi:putative transcriptional regulator